MYKLIHAHMVLEDLNKLGSSRAIAEVLELEEMYGDVKKTNSCPISRYLHHTVGGRWTVGLENATYWGWRIQSIEMPHFVKKFIENFDDYSYPTLIKDFRKEITVVKVNA